MSLIRDLWRIATGTDPYLNPIRKKRAPKPFTPTSGMPLDLRDLRNLPFVGSFIDNVVLDTVEPVPGSVVYCGLAMNFVEHSGIYIGSGLIVHLEGSGHITSVTRANFLDRLDGFNSAITVYVSSKDGKAVGSPEVAARAKAMIGKHLDYKLLSKNCHLFTATCLGPPLPILSSTLNGVKSSAETKLDCDEWRAWTLQTSKRK